MILVVPGGEFVAAVARRGRRRFVSRKCPMWFVPNCSSMPSDVRWSSGSMTPALLIRRSIWSVSLRISSAAVLMDA